jgi:cell division protein ZapA
MTNTVEVEVAGHKFQLRTSADEDYVQQIAAYVEEKIHLLEKKNTVAQTHRIALLAALNLAEELFRERDARVRLREKAKERSRNMLSQLSRLQHHKTDK